MTLLVPNEGEAQMLSTMLGKTAIETLRLRLYSNDKTPAETDTPASYTEATGGGYANVALTAASWTVTEGAPTLAAYPTVTFTFTGGIGNIYGYYVTGDTSNKVRWAERFSDAPYEVQAAGDQISITLQISLQDLLD